MSILAAAVSSSQVIGHVVAGNDVAFAHALLRCGTAGELQKEGGIPVQGG
jgi:hypothetical protein